MSMSALASLRRKLPGFENKIGRMVADMAEHEADNPETWANHKPVRGWISVRRANPHDPLPGSGWISFLHALITETGQEITLPVIPDEFNPEPTKLVKETDTPHVFLYMNEAEAAANSELPGFVKYLESKI